MSELPKADRADAFGALEDVELADKAEMTYANLSGGQRQRVLIARALCGKPELMLLDEATASIDSYTERQIQIALKLFLKGRTAIVIAHRLATVRNADRIIVLRDGEIEEQGSHEELLENAGLYARLYRLNYASFDDDTAAPPEQSRT